MVNFEKINFYKKLILSLLILTFFIGSAYAANDTAFEPTLTGDSDVINHQDMNEVVSSSEDGNAGEITVPDNQGEPLTTDHSFNGTTFSELQSEIDNCSDGDSIYLNNNIIQTGNDFISINKSITIEGNGFTIDAQKKSAIFHINSENVVLKNIIFINGMTSKDSNDGIPSLDPNGTRVYSDSGNGGAIRWNAVNGQILECTFVNNSAQMGGAIYRHDFSLSSISVGKILVTGCSFLNNSADYYGGAIYCEHSGYSVSNSRFVNNFADYYGGAICSKRSGGVVSECTFEDNSAKSYGGAFFSDGEVNIYNCNFVRNVAKNGGAVYSRGHIIIYLCSFINNSAVNGGAIYSAEFERSLVRNSVFIGNNDTGYIIYAVPSQDYPLYNNFFTANLNWFGNNASNYDEKPKVNDEVSLVAWYVLDDNGNNAFSLNNLFLLGEYTKNISDYELPIINLTLSSDDADLLDNNVIIPSRGVSDKVSYIPTGSDKYVKGSFGSSSMIIKLSDSNLDRNESNIIADNLTINAGEKIVSYIVNLTDFKFEPLINKTIFVSFNNQKFNASSDENGIACFNLNTDGLDVGLYDVYAKFMGDVLYNSAEINNILSVKGMSNIKVVMINGLNVTSILTDTNGNPIVNASISFSNGDKRGTAITNLKGEFTIEVIDNSFLNMSFEGNKLFYPADASITLKNIKPLQKNTIIVVEKTFKRVAVDYKAGERGSMFYLTLKDADGNPLNNKGVKIGIFDKIYTVKTDKDGRAGLQINVANANYYTYGISFLGDEDYMASFAVSSLQVVKKPVTITPAKTSYAFKASAKTKTVTATLKSSNSYIPKGKQVTLAIAGKTFKATIGDKGQISFNIGSVTAKGTYKVAIKYAGSSTYSAATSKTITIKIS